MGWGYILAAPFLLPKASLQGLPQRMVAGLSSQVGIGEGDGVMDGKKTGQVWCQHEGGGLEMSSEEISVGSGVMLCVSTNT